MAGYLIAVHYTDANTSTAKTVLIGVANGEFPDQASAIAAAISNVTAYRTSRGEAPISVTALVSATR
jgi:hypothetical protein